MTLRDWLKGAKTKVDSLDAELIVLNCFVIDPEKRDRSWITLNEQRDLLDIMKVQVLPERQTVMQVRRVGEKYVTAWVPKKLGIADVSMASIYSYKDTIRNTIGELDFEKYLARAEWTVDMRAKGVPLAYLTGHQEFYGRQFLVSPDVLIPRVETEALIDLVKGLKLSNNPRILEVGTGSGCVAITLGQELPQARIYATDISDSALDVADVNNDFYGQRVELSWSNMLGEFIETECGGAVDFDVVVANLPYVSKEWEWVDQSQLSFEPQRALYARAHNGLSFYKRLFKELYSDTSTDYVVVEADPCQHQDLIKLARWRDFIHVQTLGYGLLFENRFRYWWDYGEQKLVHKTEAELADESDKYAKCKNYEAFTNQELKARREPAAECEEWFR